MKLSLAEAATVLGKSERQVRYLIKQGTLKAQKDNGKWTVESADLPLSEEQRRAIGQRVEVARESFERGLEPARKAADSQGKGSYSVTQLGAFQAGQAILRDLEAGLGTESPARAMLFSTMALLARGCHSFHAATKAARYVEARETAATALTHLLLDGNQAAGLREALARRIEDELIPQIAKLAALYERRSQRARFERFGSNLAGGRQTP